MSNPRGVTDPVIDEVRAVRRRISARFDQDPNRLVQHYMELQKRHEDLLIGRSEVPKDADEPAA
jgi:hypothetical protein